ncbi:MAG: hypothetical protein KDC87_04245, partial [Planctomycetes bacterium]|nr:hypothetical protein [Planctomycetota bacterium]
LRTDIPAHRQACAHAVFSADGRWIATASHDTTAKVWNAADGALLHTLPGNGSQLWTIAFARNGRYLALAGDSEVCVYAVRPGKKPWTCTKKLPIGGDGRMPGSAFDIEFSPDSRRLFVGNFASQVEVWDTGSWKRIDVCDEHGGPADGRMIEFLDFHPDGKTLVAGGRTFTTRILRVGPIGKKSGKAVGSGKSKRKRGWTTVQTIAEPVRRDGHPTHRMCAQFSPDGTVLAVGGTDGLLQVFDAKTWRQLQSFPACPGEYCAALGFRPGSKRLLTAAKVLRVWDTTTWKKVAEVPLAAHTQHLSVSPDGTCAALAGIDGHLRIISLAAAGTAPK